MGCYFRKIQTLERTNNTLNTVFLLPVLTYPPSVLCWFPMYSFAILFQSVRQLVRRSKKNMINSMKSLRGSLSGNQVVMPFVPLTVNSRYSGGYLRGGGVLFCPKYGQLLL